MESYLVEGDGWPSKDKYYEEDINAYVITKIE